MKLTDFVCFEAIIPELKADDRDGAITELVEALDKARKLGEGDLANITKAIIKREKEASTGMGKGVAVPHVKHKAVKKPVVAIGRSSKGIGFMALDKQPVHSVIVLISPINNPDVHLQVMENIFQHIQKEMFRKFLRQLDTAEKIEDMLREADENASL